MRDETKLRRNAEKESSMWNLIAIGTILSIAASLLLGKLLRRARKRTEAREVALGYAVDLRTDCEQALGASAAEVHYRTQRLCFLPAALKAIAVGLGEGVDPEIDPVTAHAVSELMRIDANLSNELGQLKGEVTRLRNIVAGNYMRARPVLLERERINSSRLAAMNNPGLIRKDAGCEHDTIH